MQNISETISNGLVWYVVFLFSTTLHEASHAFVSYRLGDRTAYEGGQVTLNPVPHIMREKLGLVVVPIITFILNGWMIGWASAPYDYNWAMRYPKKSAMMAAAGPSANLFLVILSAVFIHIGINLGGFYVPDTIYFSKIVGAYETGYWPAASKFVSILFSLNLILFVFNLLPIPPLDGSGIIKLFLPEGPARRYMQFLANPGLAFLGLIVAWNLFDYIYSPVWLFVINLVYPGSGFGR